MTAWSAGHGRPRPAMIGKVTGSDNGTASMAAVAGTADRCWPELLGLASPTRAREGRWRQPSPRLRHPRRAWKRTFVPRQRRARSVSGLSPAGMSAVPIQPPLRPRARLLLELPEWRLQLPRGWARRLLTCLYQRLFHGRQGTHQHSWRLSSGRSPRDRVAWPAAMASGRHRQRRSPRWWCLVSPSQRLRPAPWSRREAARLAFWQRRWCPVRPFLAPMSACPWWAWHPLHSGAGLPVWARPSRRQYGQRRRQHSIRHRLIPAPLGHDCADRGTGRDGCHQPRGC